MAIRIKNLNELKSLASEEPIQCFISLFESRSSKTIQYFQDGMIPDSRIDIQNYKWDVFSAIDDEDLEIEDDEELDALTNIVDAIGLGAMYFECKA